MKKIVIIALCFMAFTKANSQIIDTTFKDCIAAKLKVAMILTGDDFKKDTATHFAFIEDKTTFDKWTVTISLRSKTENFVLKTLDLTRKDFDEWDGSKENLLYVLLQKFNLKFGLQLSF